MKNKLLILAMVVAAAVGLSSCGALKFDNYHTIKDVIITQDPMQTFDYDNWSHGLEVHVEPTQPMQEETKGVYHYSGQDFFYGPTVEYVYTMGLREMSSSTDYQLFVKINKADVFHDNFTAIVEISVNLKNAQGTEVFSQNRVVGYGVYREDYVEKKNNSRVLKIQIALDDAYTKALEQINWNRIASFLRTEQLPKEEPQKQVQGYGDTALENTIIRWDVQSRPQGADIFWRVVSKTPEVKSTNNKYLMTTPYEATKSLDIKGLTYQTSGDVRIILRCEKDGYHPQEKEYNVRMVIDQEEISAFFRLVKEGE